MIPFKFVTLGYRQCESGISENTVYRNKSGIDTIIGMAVKFINDRVSCMIISTELNESSLVRRVVKQFPIEPGQKPPAALILYSYNAPGITPMQCMDVINHRKKFMHLLPHVVFVDWMDFKDYNAVHLLDLYAKQNEILVVCKHQVPYNDDGLPV